MTKKSWVIPGDELAVSEEFLPGSNVYDDGGMLRALLVGEVREDKRRMEIAVKPSAKAQMIKAGDYVTGQVDVAQTSSAGITIYFLNGKRSDSGFSGSLVTRSGPPGRGPRRGPPVKLGDVVRCRVTSTVNGMIHLALADDQCGVLCALCGNCGRPLLRAGEKVKCDECGNVEDRRLASDFGRTPIQP